MILDKEFRDVAIENFNACRVIGIFREKFRLDCVLHRVGVFQKRKIDRKWKYLIRKKKVKIVTVILL